MSSTLPKRVVPGEPLSAANENKIVDAIIEAGQVSGPNMFRIGRTPHFARSSVRRRSRLAKVISHDGAGVYTLREIEHDGTELGGSDFSATEVNADISVAVDTLVVAIPSRGHWGFLRRVGDPRVFFDGCCNIHEGAGDATSGENWSFTNLDTDGTEQQLLLHLTGGPYTDLTALPYIFLYTRILCTFGGASSGINTAYRFHPIIQDFDWADDGSVAPRRNTWNTAPTFSTPVMRTLAYLQRRGIFDSFANGESFTSTPALGNTGYVHAASSDLLPMTAGNWLGLTVYGIAVQVAPQDAAIPDVTGHAGGTYEVIMEAEKEPSFILRSV